MGIPPKTFSTNVSTLITIQYLPLKRACEKFRDLLNQADSCAEGIINHKCSHFSSCYKPGTYRAAAGRTKYSHIICAHLPEILE